MQFLAEKCQFRDKKQQNTFSKKKELMPRACGKCPACACLHLRGFPY